MLAVLCRGMRKRRYWQRAAPVAADPCIPPVLLSSHTGLRNKELRLLRWKQVDLLEREVIVGKSKTVGGEGRKVPMSDKEMVDAEGIEPTTCRLRDNILRMCIEVNGHTAHRPHRRFAKMVQFVQ